MKRTTKNVAEDIRKTLKKDTFTQGLNSYPILLHGAAWSGFPMWQQLGYGYTTFVFRSKDGWGEMVYLKSDLNNVWVQFKKRAAKNPKYLQQIRKLYDKNFEANKKWFRKMDTVDLKKSTGKELAEYFNEGTFAQNNSGNVGHVVEGLSYGLEIDLRARLHKEVPNQKDFNFVYGALSAPTKPSFTAVEQKQLAAIAKLPKARQAKALEAHVKKYYWVHNSYAGAKVLTASYFAKQLKSAKHNVIKQVNKKQLAKEFGLSKETLKLAGMIDFITTWQDDRKADIMKTIGYFDPIIRQLERKAGLPKFSLGYATTQEGLSWSFADIKRMKGELINRSHGVYMLMTKRGEEVISGAEYKKLFNSLQEKSMEKQTELHGSIANTGTARGNVVLCTAIKMMSKVRRGDILVTSMTRPEYMPILRKVSAIVTDEGGITSHAAIVARELNIPAVIGTKIATKVLKDGDKVEVRANHGVVRKI